MKAGDIHELARCAVGLVWSKVSVPSKLRARETVSASSRMVPSSPVPMLMRGGSVSVKRGSAGAFVEVEEKDACCGGEVSGVEELAAGTSWVDGERIPTAS
jgi:hypothetical protein